MLRELVEQHGTKAWAKIASIMRTKGSKQCRWVALVWLQAAVGFHTRVPACFGKPWL